MSYKIYLIGGSVRDQLMGLKSKDLDYTFVFDDPSQFSTVQDAFKEMESIILSEGNEIYLSTPYCFTIRYKDGKTGEPKDIVLARKETSYIPGTRKPIVELGTLYDDQSRRDATVNSIAMGSNGKLIDPFNGVEDIKKLILNTPLDPVITFNQDALRIIRFLRFSITKGFRITNEIIKIIQEYNYDEKFIVISEERIREELVRCFQHDTKLTLDNLYFYYKLSDYIFTKTNIWLLPTLKK